jgi:hypothetical protein
MLSWKPFGAWSNEAGCTVPRSYIQPYLHINQLIYQRVYHPRKAKRSIVTDSMKRMEAIVQSALQQQQHSGSNWRNRQSQPPDQRQWNGGSGAPNARPPTQAIPSQDSRSWNSYPGALSVRPPPQAAPQQTQLRPQGQWNTGQPQRQRIPLDEVDCFRCGLLGHYQNDCPGRVGTIQQGNEKASLQGQGWPTQQ